MSSTPLGIASALNRTTAPSCNVSTRNSFYSIYFRPHLSLHLIYLISALTTRLVNLASTVKVSIRTSVTRLGDILHFGQLFKACGNNYFAQIAHILAIFVKVSKSYVFLVKSFLGNFGHFLLVTLVRTNHHSIRYMIVSVGKMQTGLGFLTAGCSCMPLAFRTLFLHASRSSLLFSRILLSLTMFFISPSRNRCSGPIMDSWPCLMYSRSISPNACSVWPTRINAEPEQCDFLIRHQSYTHFTA